MIGSLLSRAHTAFMVLCGKQTILTAPPADPVAVADAKWLADRAAYARLKSADDRGRGEARRRAAESLNAALKAFVASRQTMRRA